MDSTSGETSSEVKISETATKKMIAAITASNKKKDAAFLFLDTICLDLTQSFLKVIDKKKTKLNSFGHLTKLNKDKYQRFLII